MINVTLVKSDATAIQFSASSWKEAVEEILRRADGPSRDRNIEKVFMSGGGGLEEHKIYQLREDLASGSIDN